MIIVTGGAGFIGSVLVGKLNKENISDIIVVDSFGDSDKWKNLLGKRFRDYIDRDKFLELVKSDSLKVIPEAIIHLGACSSTTERNVDFLYTNNFLYTKNLAEYCLKHGIRFIYASSAATYGDGSKGYVDTENELRSLTPLNAYGFSKWLFDTWAFENNILSEICGIKFFNVFGPNEYHKDDMRSMVFKSWEQIKTCGKVRLFKSYRPDFLDGEQKRDFIYVKDCCDIIWWLIKTPTINGIINLGSGEARSWKALACAVFNAMNLKADIEFIDMPELIRHQYQYFTEANMRKLRNFGWTQAFTSLEDGVLDYVKSYLESSQKYY